MVSLNRPFPLEQEMLLALPQGLFVQSIGNRLRTEAATFKKIFGQRLSDTALSWSLRKPRDTTEWSSKDNRSVFHASGRSLTT